jgi:polar amino acid transport system substrate-binding protein
MTLSRRVLLAAAATLLALGAPSVQAEDLAARIAKTGTIRIAVPTDYPPYGFVGIDLAPQGLDIDMANLVAEKLEAKLELVPVTSANRIPYVQTSQVDLVISTLGKNEERMKVIDFSHAYAPFFQAAYAAKSLQIKTFADLDGKSIAVAKGAMEEQELVRQGPPGMNFKRYEDQAASTASFVAGQAQVLATSVSNAALMAQNNPHLEAELKLIIKESACYVGVAKGQDALLAKVNAIVLAAKADGTLNAMSLKWLQKPLSELPL